MNKHYNVDRIPISKAEGQSKWRIAVLMLPELGAFNATFKLSRGLVSRGHHLTYIGPECFAEQVSQQGFEYSIINLPQNATCAKVDKSPSLWRKYIDRCRFAERYWLDFDALSEQVLREVAPDLVLLDPLVWLYATPLLRLEIKIIGLNTTLASTFSQEYPPVFSDIIPRQHEHYYDRFRYLFAWMSIRIDIPLIWDLLNRNLAYLVLGRTRSHRLNHKKSVEENGGRLVWGEYGWRLAVPELVLAPRAIDLPCVVRSSHRHYVGACVDMSRNDGEFDWRAIKQSKPLIYCSLGTYSRSYPASKRLFTAVVDAVQGQAKWQAIIQVGNVMTAEEFGPLPDHVRIVERVPQLEILAHTDIFITHGGFSSVREACFNGVPMIVFPCWLDQPGNAARVVCHRLGVRADIKFVDARMILDLIDQVQAPDILEGIHRMKSKFHDEAGCALGIDWIEEFLERNA